MKWYWGGGDTVGERNNGKKKRTADIKDVFTLHLTGKLTTLQDSINAISFDLHEAIPPCTEKKRSAFFGIQLLPQISWYSACWNCIIFPLCISSISLFLRTPLAVYVRENPRWRWSVVWWHSIAGSLHSEIARPNDSVDLSWVIRCSC